MPKVTLRDAADRTALGRTLSILIVPALVLIALGAGVGQPSPVTGVVSVVIRSDHLEIPDSITAGDVTFHVTNRDTVTHGLGVRRDGVDVPVGSLDAPVQPGARATARIIMKAGSYHVYCPNAVERGLIEKVTVIPETSSEARLPRR